MEETKQKNHIKYNYQYLCDNYILPEWFNYNDIDWIRYYPMKNEKIYECVMCYSKRNFLNNR